MINDFSSENYAVYDIMSKYVVISQRTQTIWHLRVAYWISKPTRASTLRALAPTSTYTHTDERTHVLYACPRSRERARALTHTHARVHTHTQKNVIRIAFHGNSGFVKALQCCVTRTLPVLLLHL